MKEAANSGGDTETCLQIAHSMLVNQFCLLAGVAGHNRDVDFVCRREPQVSLAS
jgi:hypothetical protein